MNNIFFISDTHWSHSNILRFTDSKSGELIRPQFNSIEEMNETLIQNWNKVVTPQDKVYHLGDVIFGANQNFDKILSRLNGKKRLIAGNHDDLKDQNLTKHFQKISLWRIFKEFDFLVSHVPIFHGEIRKVKFNVHGHIHQNPDVSPFHLNISVEKTNYIPISVEEVIQRLKRK